MDHPSRVANWIYRNEVVGEYAIENTSKKLFLSLRWEMLKHVLLVDKGIRNRENVEDKAME